MTLVYFSVPYHKTLEWSLLATTIIVTSGGTAEKVKS